MPTFDNDHLEDPVFSSHFLPNSDNPPYSFASTSHANHTCCRHSKRIKKKPSYLTNYVCPSVVTSPGSLSKVVSYSNLAPGYKSFALNVSSYIEPKTYAQFVQLDEWKDAMAAEKKP